MKILVTGASGFLGRHLVQRLEERHETVACWGSRETLFARAVSERLDFTDADQCRLTLERHRPTHVVHAGAMALTGECEANPDLARRVNAGGTANVIGAIEGAASPPHLVFLSTDLVFDGRKPGGLYAESDEDAPPAPLMVYGKTKLEAERLIAASSRAADAAVLRSALIYGAPAPPALCFLDWMIAGIGRGEGALFTDEFRSPVFVDDLCAAVEAACERQAAGTYHVGGPERISRYDFGLLVADEFGLPRENVRAAESASVALSTPRPADVSMDIGAARSALGYNPRPPREGLRAAREAGS